MAEPGGFKVNSRVQIKGLRELRQGLKAFDREVSRDARKRINDPVSQLIVDRTLPWVPKKSGNLQRSVSPKSAATYAGAEVKRSAAPYANFIHWGANGWPKARGTSGRETNKARRRNKKRLFSIVDDASGRTGSNKVRGTFFIWRTIKKLTANPNSPAIQLMERGVQQALDEIEGRVNRSSI